MAPRLWRVRLVITKPDLCLFSSMGYRQHSSISHKTLTSTKYLACPSIHDPDHSFYNYTSGRWLYNEGLRLAERRHQFDVLELCRTVAESIGRSTDDVTTFAKIAEGGSYRIFEATFRDGMKLIARLPYPCTLPHKYGIASEVATMEFLRLKGVPIPKVLDWSSSTSNPIGSEYMIMESVAGKELQKIEHTMMFQERRDIVEKIVDVERTLFDIQFPASGSIYFKESLDTNITTVDLPLDVSCGGTDKFCVGPSTELLWWYQRRDELEVNRGPWNTPKDLLEAVGHRELSWLQKFGKPRYPREPLYREFYGYQMVDPQIQIESLSDYLKIAPHIVPENHELTQPTIRHPDLTPNNIFISESGDIAAIIDWQHSVIIPAFLQAKVPRYFNNYGDDDSQNCRRPKLPEDFESLSETEKETETERYRRRQLHYFYLGSTYQNNKPHSNAMKTYDLIMRNRLFEAAGRPWEGDNASLRAEIVQASSYWPKMANSVMKKADFPAAVNSADATKYVNIDKEQKDADAQMERLRDFVGINIDGWMPNEFYEKARANEQHIMLAALEAAETEEERRELVENWPFKDHEEVD